MKLPIALLSTALLFILVGCDTYITPGTKADLAGMAPANLLGGFQSEPSNPFPASIVAVRVQGRNYSNYNLGKSGGVVAGGRYSVISTREVEREQELEALNNLPSVTGIISLNRLLLPDKVDTLEQLRESASKLKGDLLFLYTFDTVFYDEDKARVLTTISLGFSPNKKITATTTASALLIDTRTGYIYSAYESTAQIEESTSLWGSREDVDKARLSTEREAFSNLVKKFVASWGSISS